MTNFFNQYFYEPLMWFFYFIYKHLAFSDVGLAIIILTVIVRIILFPLFYQSVKDQVIIKKIQPQIKEIQNKYKTDKEKQAQELFKLYRDHKFNPLSSFFVFLIQLPVLLALFKIFTKGLADGFDNLLFIGLINLAKPNMVLTILAAVVQYWQTRLTVPWVEKQKTKNSLLTLIKSQPMTIIGPILTLIILKNLPSALALYWTISSLFSIVQYFSVDKKLVEKFS